MMISFIIVHMRERERERERESSIKGTPVSRTDEAEH